MTTTQTMHPAEQPLDIHDPFPDLLHAVRRNFAGLTIMPHVFRVQTDVNLFDLFLSELPKDMRQHYTCNACRSFMKHYGSLVGIDNQGTTMPLMWPGNQGPKPFTKAVIALFEAVRRGKVVGVFLTETKVWGTPQTGDWTHLAVEAPESLLAPSDVTRTIEQRMAEKSEEFKMLARGLADFPADVMRKALTYLQSGALDRAEKHIDLTRWLIAVQDQQDSTKNAELRRNLLWRAVVAAPPGWAHVRSGMIGTLLEDVQAGLSFDAVKRKYNAKMDPLEYQRPKAEPSEGNIAQAEKVIARMQSAGSFARRFAKLEDLETIWKPRPPAPPKDAATEKGVFDHLRKAKPPAGPVVSDAAPKTMTWRKFRETVLPDAEKIEMLISSGTLPFAAFTTAVDPDSPVLFQWGHHVAWYFYAGHSSAAEWNLEPFKDVEVTALAMTPTAWGDKELEHQGLGVMFCLRGAKDLRNTTGATGIFPESLRSEYHQIRKTLEAHNKTLRPEGRDEAEACGLLLMKGAAWGRHIIRVTANGIRANYHLDRWD